MSATATTLPADASTRPTSVPGFGGHHLLDDGKSLELRRAYRYGLSVSGTVDPALRGVLQETLERPGGLARAELVFWGLQRGSAHARFELARIFDLAIAIEYFHTASLLLDDLPSMDDSSERRGAPCVHRRYGEAATILGSLAFVTRAYELCWRVIGHLPVEAAERASELVASCLGAQGILDGQARDLSFGDDDRTPAAVLSIAEGKTVCMMRLALQLPALVIGESRGMLCLLDRLALAWGVSYQILDDFADGPLTASASDDGPGSDLRQGRPNLPLVVGAAKAIETMTEHLSDGRAALELLVHNDPSWSALSSIQDRFERSADAVGERCTTRPGRT